MNSKVLNDLSARIARIETLLENKDAFDTSAPTDSGGLNYQGSQFGGIQFGDNYFQTQDGSGFGGYQPYNLDQQLEENYGFGPTEATINDLMNRIAELELMVAGGSRDTNQAGALDAGQSVGDDGSEGAGSATGDLGTMSEQDASSVAITGGSISGITDLAVADGGTGASTAAAARTNLGLGTIATQNSNAVSVTGGSITNISTLTVGSGAIISGTITSGTILATAPSAADADVVTASDSGGDAQVIMKTTTLGGRIDLQAPNATTGVILKYDNSIGFGSLTVSGGLTIAPTADLYLTPNKIGFFTGTAQLQQTVTGAKAGNAALTSLLSKLASYGLIVDSTT